MNMLRGQCPKLWLRNETPEALLEPIFADLADVAAQIAQAPIASITVNDGAGLRCQSRIRLPKACFSPSMNFYALLGERNALIIPNLRLDPSFAESPLVVASPYLRFFAGVPIVAPDGQMFGTVAVLDTVPRELSAEQQSGLSVLASQVVAQLRLREALRERDSLGQELGRAQEQAGAGDEFSLLCRCVARELEAPLRALKPVSQKGSRYRAPELGSGSAPAVDVGGAAGRIQQLVDDLLAASGVGQQPLQTEWIDMTRFVCDLVETQYRGHGPWGADFSIELLPPGQGDPQLLRQVFVKLIRNALDVSASQDRAIVRIGSRKRDQQTAYYVSSHWAGLEMGSASRPLEHSGFLQERRSEFDGYGLGLVLARRLVERQGGRLWAEFSPNHSATWWFTLGPGSKG